MTRVFRTPIVAFSYAIQQLRRLPGARFVQEHQFLVIGSLVFVASIVLTAWAATRSPQRVSMGDLTAGSLSSLQSWIIITGDLAADSQTGGQFRYVLTDPNEADATLAVSSGTELPVGRTTVSGTLVGGNAPRMEDFAWRGQLVADSELAREPDPPWLAIGLFALAGFIGAAGRTSYPTFFKETPRPVAPLDGTMRARARRDWSVDDEFVDATLTSRPGQPLEVQLAGVGSQTIRLHSVHSGADTGVIRTTSTSEPALVVRPSTGELLFTFATDAERDSVFASLVADVAASRSQPITSG